MTHSTVVVVGAGQAAMALARALRLNGHQGSITLVGDEATPPYERPPLSKQFLPAAPAPVLFARPQWWRENDVLLRPCTRAVHIDCSRKTVQLQSGEELKYDRLVIATGGRARIGMAGTTLRTVEDAVVLSEQLARAKSLCVIGGGFLGLEVAASARSHGLEVTVLEVFARLLPSVLPPDLSDWLRGFHEKHGTQVHCGATVTAVEKRASDGFRVAAAGRPSIDVDCLVTCIGMKPNVELASQAGLRISGGVVVDENCRTSDQDVYAIGDVASRIDPSSGLPSRIESWQNAEIQGALAAAHIMGVPAPAKPVRWFWTEQYGVSIQVYGDTRVPDETVWRGRPEDDGFTVIFLKDGRVCGGVGVNAGKEIPPLRQLVGLRAPLEPRVLGDRTRSSRELLVLAKEAAMKQ